jgi:hypothetical protein
MSIQTPNKSALFVTEKGKEVWIPLCYSRDMDIGYCLKIMDTVEDECPHLYIVELIEDIFNQRTTLIGLGRHAKPMKFVRFITHKEESSSEGWSPIEWLNDPDWWKK